MDGRLAAVLVLLLLLALFWRRGAPKPAEPPSADHKEMDSLIDYINAA